MGIRARSRNFGLVLLGLVGMGCLVVGVLMLVSWEVSFFRVTTIDREFGGVACGVPLDNPGWRVGSPCHGAVNRQTGGALMILALGFACLVVAAGWAHQLRRVAVRCASVAT